MAVRPADMPIMAADRPEAGTLLEEASVAALISIVPTTAVAIIN